jgi:hypothetical protein
VGFVSYEVLKDETDQTEIVLQVSSGGARLLAETSDPRFFCLETDKDPSRFYCKTRITASNGARPEVFEQTQIRKLAFGEVPSGWFAVSNRLRLKGQAAYVLTQILNKKSSIDEMTRDPRIVGSFKDENFDCSYRKKSPGFRNSIPRPFLVCDFLL